MCNEFQILTFRSLSFLRLHSSHSLTMRPHRIQVSSSRCDRLEEAEELDTSEEPLLRREPLIERMDLESASSSLHERTVDEDGKLRLQFIFLMEKTWLPGTAGLSYGTHTVDLWWALGVKAGRYDIETDSDIVTISAVCGQPCRDTRSLSACLWTVGPITLFLSTTAKMAMPILVYVNLIIKFNF